jgi:murein DD-endopeptidase MepM/ murein hydrolase activator NlpD
MPQFSPLYPIFPWKVNQPWGTLNPAVYSQFGFTRHNGLDIAIGTDGIVRAPFNGHVFQNGFQPNGGGIYCGFLSDDEFDFNSFLCHTPDGAIIPFPAGQYRVLLDFLHLKSISAVEGQAYKTGDVLAVQDNTGFSTGPHTHIQPRRVTYDGKILNDADTNDAHGSFDPTQFFPGAYAIQQQTITYAQKALALLTQLLNRIKGRSS